MERSPKIVAILNVTEDSFSDGGRYVEPRDSIAHALRLVDEGADILEVGPASSHPSAQHVSAHEQIARLVPVLDAVQDGATPISVDATSVDVLRFAIRRDVEFLNDVRGFEDATLYPDLAAARASLVVVHSLSRQETATRDSATVDAVLESIDRFFSARLDELVRAGIAEERLIVDPGMGFFLGSRPEASIAVLRQLEDLRRRFGRPIFVSVSRKSFLQKITGRGVEQIGAATLAAELHAAAMGADYIRTHDPRALRDGLRVQNALA